MTGPGQVTGSGQVIGSVSGGCVESDVFESARDVFESGEPKLLVAGGKDALQVWR